MVDHTHGEAKNLFRTEGGGGGSEGTEGGGGGGQTAGPLQAILRLSRELLTTDCLLGRNAILVSGV